MNLASYKPLAANEESLAAASTPPPSSRPGPRIKKDEFYSPASGAPSRQGTQEGPPSRSGTQEGPPSRSATLPDPVLQSTSPLPNFPDALGPRTSTAPLPSRKPSKERPRIENARDEDGKVTLDVVQWSAPIFYVEPSEKVLTVDVMRIGSTLDSCSVSYRTILGENSEFIEYSGVLEFADHEDSKTVTMALPVYSNWSTTSEFKMQLYDEWECQLAAYLHTCRVKVIRTEAFPSKVFQDIPASEIQKSFGSWRLYFEIVWMLFWIPGITWRTVASVCIAQLPNLYLFATLIANKYMVDVVLNTSEDMLPELLVQTGANNGRNATLFCIAALYILPIPFLHYMKYVQETLDLKNQLLGFLRAHLLNQFLNYSADSRTAVGDSRFQSAINDEVLNMCISYEKLFEIMKLIGKMLVLGAFVIREDPSALSTSAAMPLCLFFFAICRSEIVTRACQTLALKNVIANRVIQETLFKYDLIAQYQQRPRMLDIFRYADNEAGEALLHLDLVKINNRGFAYMLGPLFTAITIAMKGPEVLSGTLSLGTFLTTISVYREFAELYGEIYECFMNILGTLGTTKDMAMCFNMPLDLIWRKDVNRMRRRRLKEAREQLLQHDMEHGPQRLVRTDRVRLELGDLCYSHTDAGKMKVILHNVNMSIAQGGIIGISGPHGSGKATLMQLLAGLVLPRSGSLFVPSHLRALYVPEETLFLALSAWANLIFGFPSAHPSRVKDILLALGMQGTLARIREDLRALGREHEMEEVLAGTNYRPGYVTGSDELAGTHYGIETNDSWVHGLCNSERSNFALARALITNPEVLILQRPLSALEPDDKARVMNALAENVSNHGYMLPKDSVRYRRPRTLFVSSSSYLELNFCSSIWLLDLESGGIYQSDIKKVPQRKSPEPQRRSLSRSMSPR